MIMPGLVNIHCHSRSGPIGKGIMEELGTPTFWMSGLYDAKAAFWKGSSVPGDEATPQGFVATDLPRIAAWRRHDGAGSIGSL